MSFTWFFSRLSLPQPKEGTLNKLLCIFLDQQTLLCRHRGCIEGVSEIAAQAVDSGSSSSCREEETAWSHSQVFLTTLQ